MTKENSNIEVKAKNKEMKKTDLAERGHAMWTPFNLMRHIADDMDNMFRDFGFADRFPMMPMIERDFFNFGGADMENTFTPPVEMVERDDKLVIRADLPGLKKEDIHVEFTEGRLTIKGERKKEFEDKEEGRYRSESFYGMFYRSLPLPKNVTSKDAKAMFKNGVLEVTLAAPKAMIESKKLEITDDTAETARAATSG